MRRLIPVISPEKGSLTFKESTGQVSGGGRSDSKRTGFDKQGTLERSDRVTEAIEKYRIDPEKPNPARV